MQKFNKLKWLTTFFLTTPFQHNGIINLQETHLNMNEIKNIENQWKLALNSHQL